MKRIKKPQINHIFCHPCKFFGQINKGKIVTTLKSGTNPSSKPQPPTNKGKIHEKFLKLNFYLRLFRDIIRQQNNFEWTLEHQKHFNEIKTLLSDEIPNLSQTYQVKRFLHFGTLPILELAQPFYYHIKALIKRT